MAPLSIVLGVLSLVCVALGVLLTPVPVLGALFAFAAPALAIAGIVVGGIAMSRARRALEGPAMPGGNTVVLPAEGAQVPARARQASGGAQAGVIVSALALVPALLTALTCGVCNALCSNGVQLQRSVQFGVPGGPSAWPPAGGAASDAPVERRSPRNDAGVGPGDDDAPPPAFPAPPLPSEP
jgi:hypothetical protein